MPTPRRRSAPNTPIPSQNQSQKPSSSTSSTSRSTPHPQSHHHIKSADEVAMEEAERILQTPGPSRYAELHPEDHSARAERHRRLDAVRAAQELEHEHEDGDGTGDVETGNERSVTREEEIEEAEAEGKKDRMSYGSVGSKESGEVEVVSASLRDQSPVSEDHIDIDPHNAKEANYDGWKEVEVVLREDDGEKEVQNEAELEAARGEEDKSEHTDEEHDVGADSPIEITESVDGAEREEQDLDEDDPDSTGSSSTDSESTSDEDSDSETDFEEEASDEEDEQMEKLLAAARSAAIASESSKAAAIQEKEDDGEVVLQFGRPEGSGKEAPIPDLAIPVLPKAHLSFGANGAAKASTSLPEVPHAGPSRHSQAHGKAMELDDRPYERSLTKKEKAAQPKKAIPSDIWANIPTPRSDLMPQMKRDYQALALAKTLDPKRFMKGGQRQAKIPEVFAIGTEVDQPRHLQDTTQTRERKYRPGEIVQGLVRDQSTGDYAKRKYGDLQYTRMENGRGKGWKKRSKW